LSTPLCIMPPPSPPPCVLPMGGVRRIDAATLGYFRRALGYIIRSDAPNYFVFSKNHPNYFVFCSVQPPKLAYIPLTSHHRQPTLPPRGAATRGRRRHHQCCEDMMTKPTQRPGPAPQRPGPAPLSALTAAKERWATAQNHHALRGTPSRELGDRAKPSGTQPQ